MATGDTTNWWSVYWQNFGESSKELYVDAPIEIAKASVTVPLRVVTTIASATASAGKKLLLPLTIAGLLWLVGMVIVGLIALKITLKVLT